MNSEEFETEVRAIAVEFPAGMSRIIQMTGPIPLPPDDIPPEEVADMAGKIRLCAALMEGRGLS